ncbi:MAG: hypothetical protein QM817_34120 [Archangium sp.]
MVEPKLESLLAKQWGVVARDQLAELGMTRGAIRWLVDGGRFTEFVGATLRVRDSQEPKWEQFAIAPTLLCGPGSALSHSTAALLWRVEGFKSRADIHVVTSSRTIPALPARYVVHQSKRPFEAEERGTLRVTPLARTLLDVAETLTDAQLEIALDAAQYRNPFLENELDAQLALVKSKFTPGARRLLHLLDVRGGVSTESPLETHVRRALRASSLPAPRLQYDVFDDGHYVMRIDFAWPEHKVALHCDGFTWHRRRTQFELDAEQRTTLSALGWTHAIVTQRMLETGAWLHQLTRTLDRCAPRIT